MRSVTIGALDIHENEAVREIPYHLIERKVASFVRRDGRSTITSLRHQGQDAERGRLIHATWKLDQIGDPNARWLRGLADFYWSRLPPAPQWRRSPTASLAADDELEPGPLEPSELAWLQTMIADKRPTDLDETTVHNLAVLATKTADTPDSLFVGELFRPVAEHYDSITDAANKRLAAPLEPTVIDAKTKATLVEIAGVHLADRPDIAEIADDDVRRYATADAARKLIDESATPPDTPLFVPAAAESALRFTPTPEEIAHRRGALMNQRKSSS
jgi:hypothetical protein